MTKVLNLSRHNFKWPWTSRAACPIHINNLRLKKLGKIRLESNLSLDLIYGLSFRIQAASFILHSWVQKTELIFYLADFHGRNWALFSNKTNQGRFYFPWSLLLKSSRSFWIEGSDQTWMRYSNLFRAQFDYFQSWLLCIWQECLCCRSEMNEIMRI